MVFANFSVPDPKFYTFIQCFKLFLKAKSNLTDFMTTDDNSNIRLKIDRDYRTVCAVFTLHAR